MKSLLLLVPFIFLTPIYAEVKIAVIYPVDSKIVHSVGNETYCGTIGALTEAKKEGFNIVFDYFDDERDPLVTASVANEIVKSKYDLVLGTTLSNNAIVASKLLSQAKIPFFAPLATNSLVTDGNIYSFRLAFSDKLQAKYLAKHAIIEEKAKKVLIVFNDSLPYSSELAKLFEIEAAQLKTDAVTKVVSYIDGKFDPVGLINLYLKDHYDLIFAPIYSVDMAALYAAAARQSKPISLLGADAVGGRRNFFEIIGEESKNIKLAFVRHTDHDFSDPKSLDLRKIRNLYCPSNDINMNMAAGYDVAQISLEIIKEIEKRGTIFSADAFLKIIKEKKFVGMLGNFEIHDDREVIKPVYLYTISSKSAKLWKKFQ